MAKKGSFKSDVVSDYFPDDDTLLLILLDKDLTVSLEDLAGEDLDKVIKYLKAPGSNKIDAIGVKAAVTLSDKLKRKLIARLEELKEIRDET